uniref:histidinol-phosphate transaminase n=1 Tax=Albugo laibachii Nc14 TaxID=890382 RepID=F0WI51_9STRA|nr:unnamed protein product [Albugo laibachii Nc14]|eukprot:CCA20929.1 unnamed protein product [Albugo laibachii Nc14]
MNDRISNVWFGSALAVTAFGAGYIAGQFDQLRKKYASTLIQSFQKSTIESIIRPNILTLTPYRCARDDYNQGILLDANENSLGPPLSSSEIDLLNEQLERYPCPYQLELKQAIANFRNENADFGRFIAPENVFLGVGSDEAIDLLIRICCTPGQDEILITPATYGMYSVCAHIHDVKIVSVPLKLDTPAVNPNGLNNNLLMPSFHLDVAKILSTLSERTKLIFLCSPGNPTANLLEWKHIEAILDAPNFNGLVVVDEAYIDFSVDTRSLCTLVNKYERLVVLQTFSKGFGLAGIRVGCAFASTNLIQILNNVKAPYNISKLSAKVASKALENKTEFRRKIQLILGERQRVIENLRGLSFVKTIFRSDANFVLFRVPSAFKVYKRMADKGVVIRYRGNQHLLSDCLRATIGTFEENNIMLEKLIQVSKELAI